MPPVAYPAGGPVGCEASSVSTRTRTTALLLPLLLAGPVLMAGCGDGGAADTAPSSSRAATESPTDTASESGAGESAQEGMSEAPDFPANIEADTAEASA